MYRTRDCKNVCIPSLDPPPPHTHTHLRQETWCDDCVGATRAERRGLCDEMSDLGHPKSTLIKAL